MNSVILIGRLTKQPEVRYTTGENAMAIARYTLAVNRAGKKDETDFINCVAFKSNAQFAEKYLHQGLKIAIEGHIQTGSYTNKEGKKVYTTDVIVDSQEFCEKKSEGNESDQQKQEPKIDENGFMNIPDGIEEELPFN